MCACVRVTGQALFISRTCALLRLPVFPLSITPVPIGTSDTLEREPLILSG
jgi:hypothetical protein